MPASRRHSRMRFTQSADRGLGKKRGLVEAALPSLARMQRHGHDKQLARRFAVQLSDRLREHVPEPPRRWMQLLIFQRVDRFAHSPVVRTVGNSAQKRRRRETAGAAEGPLAAASSGHLSECDRWRTGPLCRRSARTQTPAWTWNFAPAGITNWRGGKMRQRGAAERAGTRKEGATDSIQWTSEDAGHCSPARSLRQGKIERQ